jgi:hypothetical protein
MIRKSSLPDRKTRSKTMREAALDEADCPLQRDPLRSQNQMDVIRHNNKCVQLVMTESPVVLKGFKEQLRILRYLEEVPSIVRCCRDKESSGS